MYFWICVFVCIATITETTHGICDFNLDPTLNSKAPATLTGDDILNPHNRNGDVTIHNDETIQLLCFGRSNQLMNGRNETLTTAKCTYNKFRLYSDKMYSFDDLQCKRYSLPTIRENGVCNMQSKKIEIGFQITNTKFLPLIELCFDPNRLITYWSHHVLKNTEYLCHYSESTVFKKDFFNVTTNIATFYASTEFDKGHLSPKCDFFSGPEKRTTFYYVNSAPQVKQFNRQNWRSLEEQIRKAFNRRQKVVTVYTGSAHTVEYLKNIIPVQLYFWKVVIDPVSGGGVAFVGINSVKKEVSAPCQEVNCDKLRWLSKKFLVNLADFRKGKIYCCTVQSLQTVPSIQTPQFDRFNGHLLEEL